MQKVVMSVESHHETLQELKTELYNSDVLSGYMKPCLNKILAAYDEHIRFLENEAKDQTYLNRELITAVSRKSTSKNYEEYISSLEKKLSLLEVDNERLADKIKQEQLKREWTIQEMTACHEKKVHDKLYGSEQTGLSTMELCTTVDMLPSEWASPDRLQEKLQEMKDKCIEIEDNLCKNFVSLQQFKNVEKAASQKEKQCCAYGMVNNTLKNKLKKIKVAIEAANSFQYHAYSKGPRTVSTMGDVVVAAVKQYENDFSEMTSIVKVQDTSRIKRPKSFESKRSFMDDCPLVEQEAELTMDYIDHFSKLFASQKFEEAAHHALYSPKGILRTPRTLKYFKDIDKALMKANPSQKSSHLLHYVQKLMATIDVVGKQPSVLEAIEAVKCAVKQDRVDLIEYWIAKHQIPLVEAIGNILLKSCTCEKRKCLCKKVALAEVVFNSLAAHQLVINVMIHQGRYATALYYAKTEAAYRPAEFARLLEDDLGNKDLSVYLVQLHPDICIEKVIVSLVYSLEFEKAVTLVKVCQGRRPLSFTIYNVQYSHCKVSVARKFAIAAKKDGFEGVGLQFLSAVIVSSVIEAAKLACAACSC